MSDLAEFVRAFVAVDLGPAAQEAARALQRELAAALPRGTVRWARPEQLHLTLWFLGNVVAERLPDLRQALGGALEGTNGFGLQLDRLGAFPSPRAPRVLWLGLGGDFARLGDLQERVARAAGPFGDHQEARAFHPHLTLGRVNRPDAAVGRAFQAFAGATRSPAPCAWEVGEVRCLQSRLRPSGAEYAELARFALAASQPPGR
jgi:RNA 2',3'-cyclic 3'-phosphodiesterase